MSCPLCQLGFKRPHSSADWSLAQRRLHEGWRHCGHDVAVVLCEHCHPKGEVELKGRK